MTVLRMFQKESTKVVAVVKAGKVMTHAGRVAPRAQRLLIGLQRLFEPFAKPRLQLFLGDIPDTCLLGGAVEIDPFGPAIGIIQHFQRLTYGGAAIDPRGKLLIGMHAGSQRIHQVAMRLQHQRDKRLLPFQ